MVLLILLLRCLTVSSHDITIQLNATFVLDHFKMKSNFVGVYVTGNESASDTYRRIFQDMQAEVVSRGHEWTEGPVIITGTYQNSNNDILIFSDVPRDLTWRYEEGTGVRQKQSTIIMENSGRCQTARLLSECSLAAEPGSNGKAYDPINKNLLVCQHGSRAVEQVPLNSSGFPIPDQFSVSANID